MNYKVETEGIKLNLVCAENRWTSYFCLLYILLSVNFYLKLCRKLRYNLGVLSNYAPGGGTVVVFCGRILALRRWNLQMSWYKCPGVPGMAADKCITYTQNPGVGGEFLSSYSASKVNSFSRKAFSREFVTGAARTNVV